MPLAPRRADPSAPPGSDPPGRGEPAAAPARPDAGGHPSAPARPDAGGHPSAPSGGTETGDASGPGARPGMVEDAPATETGSGSLRARDVWAAARARRRALRREMRRFTARQRRRRRVWIASVGAVLALVLGSIAAAYSPLFSVERISVVGTSSLDVSAVQTALAPQLGTPLPLIDESEIKAALVGFPLVESYTVEARPPHELVVRIVERTPVGAVSGEAGFTLVDAAGVALSTTPEAPEGYPLIEVEPGLSSPAFAAAGQVFRSLPEQLRTQVVSISATTANDVTLTLSDGRVVVWGGAAEAAQKTRTLEYLMAQAADASGYDVSSPDAAVVR